jgi:hypothetical protein
VDGYYRSETLEAIKKFISDGGLLVGINIRELKSLEDDKDWIPVLFAGERSILIGGGTEKMEGKPTGTLSVFDFSPKPEAIASLQQHVFDPITKFLSEHGVPVYDGKIDNIFTAVRGGGLLVMNYNGSAEPYEREFLLPNGETRRVATVDSTIYEL